MRFRFAKQFVAACVALALCACGVDEQSPTGSAGPESFALVGAMVLPRRDHTATLLNDGTVLIAGGVQGVAGGAADRLTGAEIYDPSAGRFRSVGNLPAGRAGHVAALLKDGRVLIAGGGEQEVVLYDPSRGEFVETGASSEIGTVRAAVAMADGRVLLLGDLTRIVEIFDPGTGEITRAANAGATRVQHTATLLNGGVMVIGGGIGLSERYDPSIDLFLTPADAVLQVVRFGHTATLLADGRVLVAGGSARVLPNGLFAPVSSAEIYDPETETFTLTGRMGNARFGHVATLLPDGKVLVVAGAAADAEVFDPATGQFHFVGRDEGRVRSGATATLLPDGRVLIAGGVSEDFVLLNQAVVYNP